MESIFDGQMELRGWVTPQEHGELVSALITTLLKSSITATACDLIALFFFYC